MLTPAAIWHRAAERLRDKDPDYDALRRAVRATIVIPIAAAAGFAVGGASQTPLFAIFGAVSLLITVDFPGNRPARALAYGGLAVNGAVLIVLGTVLAPHPWAAVVAMFVVGTLVSFSGVLSEIVAAGQRATLLLFILPLCTPVGPIPERLLGWLIALAICIPAALFLFGPRHHDELRRHAAQVCRLLADRLRGQAGAREVNRAMNALYDSFMGADYRPVALSAGSRALVRVVDDLGWICDQVADDTGELFGDLRDPTVRVLLDSAALLQIQDRNKRALRAVDLRAALAEQRRLAQGSYRDDIAAMLATPDDATAVEVGRSLLERRTISATIAVAGRVIGNAAFADARPVWARVLGRRLPETGAADWVMPETVAVAQITRGLASTQAVVLRNSLRTGLGLAAAVAVTHLFPVEHGFWVVLGAMSVLRSSALATGTRVWRAVLGTAIGFVLGALLIELVGVNPVVMWILLPVVAFGSAYVPKVASFIAGQAAFTMMVLINFNLIMPTGWRVGLVRVEDVVIGALVGIVVSTLMWPRGATAAVSTAIDGAREVAAQFLRAAVLRVTRGASEESTDRVIALAHTSLTASRTMDDAVRHYLSENGAATEQRAPVVRAATRATRARAAAELIADVVPPPLDIYPQTRAVLEQHAAAIYERLTRPDAPAVLVPIGERFVTSLRAEAPSTDLAVSAALPLVTAAAHLGELELLYPQPAASVG